MLGRLSDLPLLVILMGVAALAMYVPAVHALVSRDYDVAQAFFYAGTIFLVLTGMIGIATANFVPPNAARSHLVALVGAYVVLPLMLAIPVTEALPDTSFVNAWFEMMSSFTTTGASVYDPARLPGSVHLWRGLVGWFGGFFILLMAIAVLAPLNLGGAEIISGRTPGRGGSQITRIAEPAERVARYALTLFPVYLALTVVLWIGLIMAGDTALVALIHAMSTLATSGISPVGGPGGGTAGLAGEMMIFVFLAAGITRRALPGAAITSTATPLHADPEVRMAGAILLVVTAVLFVRHLIGAIETEDATQIVPAAHALWAAMFTTLSFLTTTGFDSDYWLEARLWSGVGSPGMILLGLAIIGGGVATTAGGVKLLRVYALFRHGQRELERVIHPNSVGGQGSDARRMRREGAYLAFIFFLLFAISIGAVMAALTIAGVGFEPALPLAIAALTTTGTLPAFTAAVPISYAGLDTTVKIILAAAMVVGRLETLAILALISPDSWRR